MLFLFLCLTVLAALWEAWAVRDFVEGTALPPDERLTLWWIGLAANSALLLWMVRDCLTRPLRSCVRNRWLAVIIFLGVVGTTAYFFTVKMRKSSPTGT
ncbi:MAG: PLDc N-terminal domain-containing protein [Candidatus Binatia bacterium]